MSTPKTHVHHIPAQNNVDSIDVFITWYRDQAFQITIRCWDHAWTAYRGGCGHDRLEDYFIECWCERGIKEHLINLFIRATQCSKREKKWLAQILGNMCEYFKNLEVKA
ncbi:hypothetical protein RFH42_01980 [Acinetobacter rudis]|uniref:hypothetical protein n=1 Tax=Acinetobacter rudis TaxID=632955 RepID=UPI00280F1D19|nr:hypothetical protein [Acinetobacter rudis]MDQ8951728.1 hypothetical protein [Acinetobacter rudis]